jgi:mono/diheme cytochrome c family protein
MNTTQKSLVLAIAIVAALHFVGWSDHRVRNYEVMPDMVTSVPYGSLDANPNFADGKTAQAPVEGTIARGFAPLQGSGLLLDTTSDWKAMSEAQRRAWDAYAMPAGAEDDPARGRAVFQAICATCHGAGGAGDGKATKRGVPPPPSLAAEGAVALSDGRIFRIITVGQGNMAPHAAQVARADRWRVVRYVRSLQK